ncbi:MAG: beta-glucosidase [Flavobacteriales bacterium]|nr:beta-glucosidase [Flavobacteriales bacterium]
MNRDPENSFKWGVSTAAYQIEGAHDIDGKGPSIWDTFANKKRKIHRNQNGNIACDHYNRYQEDIDLIRDLNIPNYRFSISWSRIFPEGVGPINMKGIHYYHRLIDYCLKNGIEPWITLYHWDLPDALEKKGGWTNRDILIWFEEFVSFCIKTFGDKVKHWMVLNEPLVFTGAGYFLGVHAPGKKGLSNFLAASHHAALCQAHGGRIIKSIKSDLKVGTTFSYSPIEPFNPENSKDLKATKKANALVNRLFIEPLLGLGYPVNDFKILTRIEKFVKANDEKDLKFEMDFIGLQNYTRELVKYSPFVPILNLKVVKASKRKVEKTLMNWEVHPPSIYQSLMELGKYSGVSEIIITENGAAFSDSFSNGKIKDEKRVIYLKEYIEQVLKAKNDGVNVGGYFVWTLLDNFEWAEGYHPTFGLVNVDFESQKRTIKDSGYWYSEFIRNHARKE